MEQALLNLLLGDEGVRAAVGDRVFWVERARKSALPAVVCHTVWLDDDYTARRRTAFVQGLIQIDCLAPTALGAIAVRDAVRAFLSGYRGGPFQGVFVSARGQDFDLVDGSTVHRSMLEARVSYHA